LTYNTALENYCLLYTRTILMCELSSQLFVKRASYRALKLRIQMEEASHTEDMEMFVV